MKNGLNIIKRAGAVLLAVIFMTAMISASLSPVSAYAEPEEDGQAEEIQDKFPENQPEIQTEETSEQTPVSTPDEPKEEQAEKPAEEPKEAHAEKPAEEPKEELKEEAEEESKEEPAEEETEEIIPAGASEGNQKEQKNQDELPDLPSTDHAKHLKQQHIGDENCSVSQENVEVVEEIGSETIIGKLDPADVFELEKISGNMARITVTHSAESNQESRKDMTGWVKADKIICECPPEKDQDDSGRTENPEYDGDDGKETGVVQDADDPDAEGNSEISDTDDPEKAEEYAISETDDPDAAGFFAETEYDDGEENFDDSEYDDWDDEDFDDSEYDDWDEEDWDDSESDDWDDEDCYGDEEYGYWGDGGYTGDPETEDLSGETDSGEADEEWKTAYYDYLVGNEFRVQAKLDAEEGSEYYVDCFGLKYYPDPDESDGDANFTIRFALYDWNQDGVPELFAYNGSRYTDGEYYMFTFQDGQMAYAGKAGYGSWYNLMPYRDDTCNVIFSEMMDPVNSRICIASFDELGQPVTKVLGATAQTDSEEEETEQEKAFETPEEQRLYEIYRTYYQKNSFSTALKFMDAPEDMDLNDDWWKIFISSVNNEYTGWTEEEKEEPVLFTAVTAKAANVRECSDKNSALVTSIPAKGTGVSVLETLTGADGKTWYRIRMDDGTTGYVRSDFFTA